MDINFSREWTNEYIKLVAKSDNLTAIKKYYVVPDIDKLEEEFKNHAQDELKRFEEKRKKLQSLF
jgi:hypothetical protein